MKTVLAVVLFILLAVLFFAVFTAIQTVIDMELQNRSKKRGKFVKTPSFWKTYVKKLEENLITLINPYYW